MICYGPLAWSVGFWLIMGLSESVGMVPACLLSGAVVALANALFCRVYAPPLHGSKLHVMAGLLILAFLFCLPSFGAISPDISSVRAVAIVDHVIVFGTFWEVAVYQYGLIYLLALLAGCEQKDIQRLWQAGAGHQFNASMSFFQKTLIFLALMLSALGGAFVPAVTPIVLGTLHIHLFRRGLTVLNSNLRPQTRR